MLPYAQSIAKLQHQCESAAFNYFQTGEEVLHIASIPVIAQYNITDILVQFQMDFPNVKVDIQEADTNLIIDLLLDRKCEPAFYRDSPVYRTCDISKESRLIKIPYQKDHLIAVLPQGHPLTGKSSIHLAQLSDKYFALIKSGSRHASY